MALSAGDCKGCRRVGGRRPRLAPIGPGPRKGRYRSRPAQSGRVDSERLAGQLTEECISFDSRASGAASGQKARKSVAACRPERTHGPGWRAGSQLGPRRLTHLMWLAVCLDGPGLGVDDRPRPGAAASDRAEGSFFGGGLRRRRGDSDGRLAAVGRGLRRLAKVERAAGGRGSPVHR